MGAASDGEWWTGRPPHDCPGWAAGRLVSLPPLDLASCTRAHVRDYFDNGWTLTELLFSALCADEAFFRRPDHRLRHPLIFYYGHPACLYVNKLRQAGLLDAPVDAAFERRMRTGVDEMPWDELDDETPWPTIAAIHDYRRRVYAAVCRVIAEHPALARPITDASPAWALVMAMEHERIHLETSSVLVRELPQHLVRAPQQWPAPHASAHGPVIDAPIAGRDFPDNPLIRVAAGSVHLGKPRALPSFGWDNEYGDADCDVGELLASRHLVSNGELLAFVQAGGYTERAWWTDAGWRSREQRRAPAFWVAHDDTYRLRLCFETIAMPWSWPAEVTCHEAKAYCRWRTANEPSDTPYRLPTEAEHRRLEIGAGAANLGLALGSPSPVDALAASPLGLHDVAGNVWRWCGDTFGPLPGFRTHPYYHDFSTPCFDGEHRLILGGSFMSTGEEASGFARFHFRPHFVQHAGMRVIRSAPARASESDVYEQPALLEQYLMLHFGDADDRVPAVSGISEAVPFPVRCARLLGAGRGDEGGAALDLGCAVGGASFELARGHTSVLAVDLSAQFIAAAQQLQIDGRLVYRRRDEGELTTACEAVVDPELDRTRVSFVRADACALAPELGPFDSVLAANLLCRVQRPRALLERMAAWVKPGGRLLLTTPLTWMPEFTPRDEWLGGYEGSDGIVRTLDTLRAVLDRDFVFVHHADLPVVLREHARKYQLIVPLATLWRRRM